MKNILLFFSFFILILPLWSQNGWTKDKSNSYSQISISSFASDDYYSQNGSLFDQGNTFRSQALILYSEYGITSRLNSVINFPVLMANSYNTTKVVFGAGNAKLGLKYRLFKDIPLSIQLDAEIPTSKGTNLSSAKKPNEIGVIEQINLPTSDGEFNFLGTVAFSHSFNQGKTFFSTYGTFNKRTKSYSDQLQIGGELGFLFLQKLYVIGKVKIQESVGASSSPSASFLYGEGTTYTSMGITLMYKMTPKWFLVGGFDSFNSLIVNQKNIYNGLAFSLGVALEI